MFLLGDIGIGAFAFAHEIIIEVPVKQETVTLEEIDLTLILPDSWSGKYSVVKDGQNYIVYNPQIKESSSEGIDLFDAGVMFYIICYEEAMTPEQFVENGLDFTAYRYLFSTSDKTYILHYASDVQWDPQDAEQENLYHQMISEIKDIQFIVNNVLKD